MLIAVLAGPASFGQSLPDGIKVEPDPNPAKGTRIRLYKEGSDRVSTIFHGRGLRGPQDTLHQVPQYSSAIVGDLGAKENSREIVLEDGQKVDVESRYIVKITATEPVRTAIKKDIDEAKTVADLKTSKLPAKKRKVERAKLLRASAQSIAIKHKIPLAVLEALADAL